MALATVQQGSSPGSSVPPSVSEEDLEDEKREELGDLPLSPAKPNEKKLVRQGSVSDNFFAVKGAALILPRQTSLATNNLQIVKKFGGELQTHLRAIFHHLRPQDNIKLAVRLESWVQDHRRYLVIISTTGRQDTDESIIVGCDFETKESTKCTIGLVLPVWCDTNIRLDGDGGFRIERHEVVHSFKPVSVQAMWSALQSLHRCQDVALKNKYYEGSLYLTWMGYYVSKISSHHVYVKEWQFRENLASCKLQIFVRRDAERLAVERLIHNKLQQVMMNMDLDNCTCREIRTALENVVDMDLRDYKEYIDNEMMAVMGQMECPSKILDYLYLGSEWNACNLEELEELGITHILNVTLEIDNFFPKEFRYKIIPLYDEEESDLLPHWNHTWRFIADAKKSGGKCLVHCRMGISRSSATVCAYLMKEMQWNKQRALDYVKSCRSIICPNSGFQKQLHEYEGILFASAQRHNKLFRSRSESSLAESHVNEEKNSSGSSPTKNLPLLPPLINLPQEEVDAAMGNDDFDFNRHLLDVATISAPKISRPKSWSPDEGFACYKPDDFNKDLLSMEQANAKNVVHHPDFRHQNLSEPVELLTPATVDPERSAKVEELRKKFANKRAHLRRHTEAAAPVGRDVLQLEDLAHSEDSVFVHDGTGSHLVREVESRGENKMQTKKLEARSSSPATINCELQPRPDSLTVHESPLHTSSLLPMNSPSYQNAKNVDIGLLKSKFSDPVPASDSLTQVVLEDVTNRVDSQDGESPEPSRQIKTSVPVREIVAVIESPSDDANKLSKLASGIDLQAMNSPDTFTKGHYKTASLPPANIGSPSQQDDSRQGESELEDRMARSRSYSEAQAFSVKKIVTEIESRHVSIPTVEEKNGDCGEIHRSMSMPCSQKIAGSPPMPVCSFYPVAESPMEVDNLSDQLASSSEKSSFYIGDAEANNTSVCEANNSNNNNNITPEVLTINQINVPTADPCMHQPLTDNVTTPSHLAANTNPQGEEERICHLSPDVLHVIREVGMQLMSDSDESSFSSSTPCHSEESLKGRVVEKTSEQFTDQAAPLKRRGIVRQMAKEIEKSVRRLTGKSSKSKPVKHKTSSATPDQPASTLNTAINKLLMGDRNIEKKSPHPTVSSSLQCPKENVSEISTRLPDARVRELVDKFDAPCQLSPSKRFSADVSLLDPLTEPEFTMPRETAKDITTSLITPPPYRPPDSSKFSSSSLDCVTKFNLDKTPRVRRSQSERVGARPQVSKRTGVFRSFRLTDKHCSYVDRYRSEGSISSVDIEPSKDGCKASLTSSVSLDVSRQESPLEVNASSPCPVRDMVRNIEREFCSSSSVHRSSSMPSSSPSRVISRSNNQPPMKALRKTKSTPLFGIIRAAYSTKKAVRNDKTKRNSK